MTKLKYFFMVPLISLGCLCLASQMPATSRPHPSEGRTSPSGTRAHPSEGRVSPSGGRTHPSETPVSIQDYSPLKLRSPIRTLAGQAMCVCPYDEVAQISSGNQALLITTKDWVLCGGRSTYSMTGGTGASCYITDSPFMSFNGTQIASKDFAKLVEEWCNNNPSACHLDVANRY